MTTSVFFIHHFLLIFATQLIQTRFFLFWTCFITAFEGDKYKFFIWETSPKFLGLEEIIFRQNH